MGTSAKKRKMGEHSDLEDDHIKKQTTLSKIHIQICFDWMPSLYNSSCLRIQ